VDTLRRATIKFDVIIAKCSGAADGERMCLLHRLGEAKPITLSDAMDNVVEATISVPTPICCHSLAPGLMKSLELVLLGELLFPPRFITFMARKYGGPGASRCFKRGHRLGPGSALSLHRQFEQDHCQQTTDHRAPECMKAITRNSVCQPHPDRPSGRWPPEAAALTVKHDRRGAG
jgi:hypothetical protein